LKLQNSEIFDFAFNPTNAAMIATVSQDATVCIYDWTRKILLSTIPLKNRCQAVDFHQDGKTILCSDCGGEIYHFELINF